mmetsp:Transcript_106147/g.298418  ORF Transcript_106147/g.298418 Transcript_106147/m.298418 type:complete len:264 (-) Transcript_106147:158-949(-)
MAKDKASKMNEWNNDVEKHQQGSVHPHGAALLPTIHAWMKNRRKGAARMGLALKRQERQFCQSADEHVGEYAHTAQQVRRTLQPSRKQRRVVNSRGHRKEALRREQSRDFCHGTWEQLFPQAAQASSQGHERHEHARDEKPQDRKRPGKPQTLVEGGPTFEAQSFRDAAGTQRPCVEDRHRKQRLQAPAQKVRRCRSQVADRVGDECDGLQVVQRHIDNDRRLATPRHGKDLLLEVDFPGALADPVQRAVVLPSLIQHAPGDG